jgi:hypothetical protein
MLVLFLLQFGSIPLLLQLLQVLVSSLLQLLQVLVSCQTQLYKEATLVFDSAIKHNQRISVTQLVLDGVVKDEGYLFVQFCVSLLLENLPSLSLLSMVPRSTGVFMKGPRGIQGKKNACPL